MTQAHVKLLVYPDRDVPYWSRAVRTIYIDVHQDLLDQLPEIAQDLAEQIAQDLVGWKRKRRRALDAAEQARYASNVKGQMHVLALEGGDPYAG